MSRQNIQGNRYFKGRNETFAKDFPYFVYFCYFELCLYESWRQTTEIKLFRLKFAKDRYVYVKIQSKNGQGGVNDAADDKGECVVLL